MELSEEEQKAIEKVKEVIKIDKENRIVTKYDEKPLFRDQLQIIIDLIDKQQKEIEEKTTILFAGAEKVKQLEKGNQSLIESRKKWKSRYYREKAKNKDYISKDKIREKIKEIDGKGTFDAKIVLEHLLEE